LEAVKRFSVRVEVGERCAIIGPNGAGKTTLFNLISGLYPVTSGLIRLNGQDITRMASRRRASLGLSRTFQITTLFSTLTVLENLVVAFMGLKRIKFSMLRPLSAYQDLYKRADEVLENMGLAEKRNQTIQNLSHGEQRQVEVSLALISNPSVLLLDEPTAGLSSAEADMMSRIIQKLDSEITLLIIEHNMDIALQVASRITVMHQGSVFAEGSPTEIRSNEQVQEIYLGSEADSYNEAEGE
jgi:branched-chain amino acid transport system ATP-binding protein